MQLANAPERLRYKASKVRSYWPNFATAERRTLLFQEWARIITLLDAQIMGVANTLPMPPGARAANFKSYEDVLDAIVCAWVAVCVLEGRATPFSDQDSAIWIPVAELLTRAGKLAWSAANPPAALGPTGYGIPVTMVSDGVISNPSSAYRIQSNATYWYVLRVTAPEGLARERALL